MLYREDLLDAIKETQGKPDNYHKCEKLATFYTLLDHLYPEQKPGATEGAGFSFCAGPADIVGEYGTSQFLAAVAGMDARAAWQLMDELMDAVSVINPRLYDGVMRKLKE